MKEVMKMFKNYLIAENSMSMLRTSLITGTYTVPTWLGWLFVGITCAVVVGTIIYIINN